MCGYSARVSAYVPSVHTQGHLSWPQNHHQVLGNGALCVASGRSTISTRNGPRRYSEHHNHVNTWQSVSMPNDRASHFGRLMNVSGLCKRSKPIPRSFAPPRQQTRLKPLRLWYPLPRFQPIAWRTSPCRMIEHCTCRLIYDGGLGKRSKLVPHTLALHGSKHV